MSDSANPTPGFRLDPTTLRQSREPPQPPPRLLGDYARDMTAMQEWMKQLHMSLLQSGLGDPVYQFAAVDIDPDAPPDPKLTTMGRSQATANMALQKVAATTKSLEEATQALAAAQETIATLQEGLAANSFEPGTRLLFQQSNAPLGWTKDTSHNNKALRIVSGTAGSGGATGFTSVFGSKTPTGTISVSGTVGNTTLTVNQIPSHAHATTAFYTGGGAGTENYSAASPVLNRNPRNTDTAGGGLSHNHSWSGSATFSGAAMDFNVAYVDAVIAIRD